MKQIAKFTALCLLSSALTVIAISCGTNMMVTAPSPGQAAPFVYVWKPTHLLGRVEGTQIASAAGTFVVNAQGITPSGGNFSGFCNAVAPTTGTHVATVIFGIGRWSSGSCDDAATPDSSVGVNVPQNGQIGNLTVDAIGTGTSANSGQMEVKIIHADGTQTITPITCTLGVSSNAKVHCADSNAADHTNVVAGDEVSARIFYTAGDSYNAIRVNIQYATPTF